MKQLKNCKPGLTQRVLFLCTGNAGRSQMAEALLRQKGGGSFEIYSAGTNAEGVNPLAIEVMKEIGIDISVHKSRKLDEFQGQFFDFVIMVDDDANEIRSGFQGARTIQWSLSDPAGLWDFKKVRYEIAARIDAFLKHERKRLSETFAPVW